MHELYKSTVLCQIHSPPSVLALWQPITVLYMCSVCGGGLKIFKAAKIGQLRRKKLKNTEH